MLSNFTKTSLKVLPQALTHTAKSPATNIHQFTAVSSHSARANQPVELLDGVFSNNSRTDVYIRNVYKYMTTASVIGVSSALIASSAIPIGLSSAGLALAGVGLDRIGTEYIKKTSTTAYAFKNDEGQVVFDEHNSSSRKLAFMSSCLGYGCIVGALTSAIPVASSVLGMSAVTGLFSTLGQLTYSKLVKKEEMSSSKLFLSGTLAGVVGVNLIGSFSTIFMFANPLTASTQMATYMGILLYNAFSAKMTQKTMEDVQNGKEDHLKRANKFSEHWLYSLAPHFMMKFF